MAFGGLNLNAVLVEVTLPITSVTAPTLVTTTLSSLPPPRATVPNGTERRVTVNPPVPPVPLRATVSGEVDPVCRKTAFPVWRFVFAGVNVM